MVVFRKNEKSPTPFPACGLEGRRLDRDCFCGDLRDDLDVRNAAGVYRLFDFVLPDRLRFVKHSR